MNKSTLSAITIAVASAAVIAWQYTQNAQLKREAHELRTTINLQQRSLPTAGGLTRKLSTNKTPDNAETGERPETFEGDLRVILAQRDPMQRIRSLLPYVESLPPDQIGKALEELRAGSPDWDPEARFLAHMLLTRWGQEDPEAAFASLKAMDFKRGGQDATSILASLAAMDPERAVAWLNDPDNTLQHLPKMGHILAGTIAKEWVRQDAESAMEWASNLPPGQRHGAMAGVLESLASTDPKEAAELVMSMAEDPARRGYVGEVAQSWGQQNPSEAMDWAQTLVGSEREKAIEQVLDGWAQSTPEEAAGFIDELPDSERTQGQISQVAREWARRDPANAAAWLSTHPEGEGVRHAMGEVMWNWTNIDPESASTWLSQQPPSGSRDIGAAALSKAAWETDPEGAVSWSATIGDEDMRAQMLQHGLRSWMRQDEAAASAWATQNAVEAPTLKSGGKD